MVEYKTSLGTVTISRLQDIPIKAIKLGKESWAWYELPKTPNSFYARIKPIEPAVFKGSKKEIARRIEFYNIEAKNEADALQVLQKRLKAYVQLELYPQTILDIINEAMNL